MDAPASLTLPITRLCAGQATQYADDAVAVEEPLALRVEGRGVAVIMRTPGHDEDLAAGFLLTEGVVQRPQDLFEISVCPSQSEGKGNVVDVLLSSGSPDWEALTRHVFTSSSCGVCGKTSVESVFQSFAPVAGDWAVSSAQIRSLPEQLRAAQEVFSQTGGLHACGLFHRSGELLVLREDVGRHNAMDKVLGHALRQGWLPLQDHLLMVSGRVSFEIMQKALAAGVPLVAAVSAPTTLAVQFAEQSGQTLIGFLRGNKMNLYAHAHRVWQEDAEISEPS